MIGHSHPKGLSQPPFRFMASHCKNLTGCRIDETVVNYAMKGRVEAGGDRVVVGECEGGEDGDEAGLRLSAIGDESGYVGCWGFELVPESEPVGGDEDDDGLVEAGERAGG